AFTSSRSIARRGTGAAFHESDGWSQHPAQAGPWAFGTRAAVVTGVGRKGGAGAAPHSRNLEPIEEESRETSVQHVPGRRRPVHEREPRRRRHQDESHPPT